MQPFNAILVLPISKSKLIAMQNTYQYFMKWLFYNKININIPENVKERGKNTKSMAQDRVA